ncbi:uncharacterized protein LOC108905838 [Anoplophora glabripennis]|uniref:uncharacterized protein LOC108905838 n=1 Tax=Anoplophora glabripennis TaxID=217634 RepID=UPI0008742D54|nr:uncharacterized protein LOC108905838 [Anoplophora glabripennis]
MDINSIWTLAGAINYLKTSSQNEHVLEKIKETIYSWNYRSEYDLESIRDDLNGIVEHVMTQHFKDKVDRELKLSISCVVYNEIYENLIPLIRGQFSKEDLYLYEKCTYLSKKNVSPGQFGCSVYNCLKFISAVVELSVLDTYKSPLEKINCLCSTYDMIYAELKLALVTIISKYSEKECEIPIINNEEVIPILMMVVIKSKLLYLWSNLFYIKFFAGDIIEENNGIRSILNIYETVILKIMTIEESCLNVGCDKIPTNLDVAETMAILSSEENLETQDHATLIGEGKKRLVSLITKATAEKNFVPLDVAKIFS